MSHKRSRAAFESTDTAPPPHAPYAVFGTPLPPYDPDARDDGSYVPVWKQEVTDEHGRKRLHGAFTGGWSAGYYNTVGSKEGWTPSSFVSSRSKRAKKPNGEVGGGGGSGQKVEDFMDEEDLAERAESQKIETQGAFAGLGGAGEGAAPASKAMFADLFRDTGETIGIKLLQRMGWKQGQGIGPKVRRRVKGDQKGEMHLFAPEDSEMIKFNRKSDRKGLGFAGEEKLGPTGNENDAGSDGDDLDARILQANRSKLLSKSKKIKKSSFGVGVLNDTGSDDENAYDMGPKISYNRVLGGEKKKKAGLGAGNVDAAVQKPGLTSKKLAQRKSTLSGFRKCHDGRSPIEGFILSLAPLSLVQENKYPPPTPSEGWRPARLSQLPSEKGAPYQSTADAAKASTLDPKARAALLGEQQLPSKSVFDFMSPAARQRVASASGKTNLPPALSEGAPADFASKDAESRRTLWDLIPHLEPHIAISALQRGLTGWTPYAEDEEKQARYKYFLELRAGRQSNLPARPRGFSIDEWAKELREFAQAAQVFKPISGLMATRFTTSTAAPKLASDAHEPSSTSAHHDGSTAGREDDPAEKAAKMDMYGPMTRFRQQFFPTRLLCKRFNVRPPANVAVDPGEAAGGEGEQGGEHSRRLDIVSQASLDQMLREAASRPTGSGGLGFAETLDNADGEECKGEMSMGQERAVVDAERNEALEGPKADAGTFKAVFGDDDGDQ